MKTNGSNYAFPLSGDIIEKDDLGHFNDFNNPFGLTKREHMAIEFTKALLSNPNVGSILHNDDFMMHEVAAWGISQADELIRLLNQDENK